MTREVELFAAPPGERLAVLEAKVESQKEKIDEMQRDLKELLDLVHELSVMAATGKGGLMMFLKVGAFLSLIAGIVYSIHGVLFNH